MLKPFSTIVFRGGCFAHIYVVLIADIGTVLKVVSIPRGTWHDLEEVLLEEMTVFRVCSPYSISTQF